MRTIISFALSITCFSFLISSCSSSETYADKLKNEKKAINRLKNDSNFVFIDTYPEDGVFERNEFYHDAETGVYYNVVDSGNGNRASKVRPMTSISVRFARTYFFSTDDSTEWKNTGMSETFSPVSFTYGLSTTYISSSSTDGYNYYIKSLGLTVPLEHVGENAVVRMIIPFTSGSYYQQYYGYEPLYLDFVKYRFDAQ